MGTPVTVSDAGSQTDPETGDVYEYVGISGFFQPAVDQGIIADDTMYFEYWNGALVSLQSTFGPTLVDLVGTGTNQYAGVLSIMGSGAGGLVSAAAIGAFTDFGDVAFVDFGQYASYGGFAYFSLGVFADEAYSSYIASLMDISNLLLVRLKYLADNEFAGLSGEALREAIKNKIHEKDSDLVGKMASEGTTPRQLTDLIGSLCDLTSGSGDKGTPIVYIQGYFDNYTTE